MSRSASTLGILSRLFQSPQGEHAEPTSTSAARAIRELLETLQAENQRLRHECEAASEIASELASARREVLLLESVLTDVWRMFDMQNVVNDTWFDIRGLAKYRTQVRNLRHDPRSGNDLNDIAFVTDIRLGVRARPIPSTHNVLLMWADERRRRECAEASLADAKELIATFTVERARP